MPLVNNFLRAMTATPLNTFVARQFLTSESSGSWVPERGTIVYGTDTVETLPGGEVALRLSDVVELDDRGTWLGDPTRGAGRDITLKLVKEEGEWRISDPPNRLIIPRSHFDTEYQQYFLYFFDKSAQVLVPEPVYAPRGLQAPTLLVAALLKGPLPSLAGVETTFVPHGTRLDGISVPVSRDNTAEVPLSDEVLDLDNNQLNLLFAQLSWTLGQIAGVERMRVTVAGTPVDLPGARVDVGVNQWSEFDPALAWASTSLFGIRDRRVVTLTGDRESRVSGPFGTLPLGLRSIAVDLPAQHVAGVSARRHARARGRQGPHLGQARHPVRRTHGLPAGHRPAPARLRPLRSAVRGGPDLGRRPAVGRAGRGRAHGRGARRSPGEPVVRFVLSRDGTRLVSQIRRDGRDQLVVSRVERDAKGRVQGLLPAVPLPLTGAGDAQIRDLGWRTPGSLAVLSAPSVGTSQVLIVKIDGSSTPEDLSTDAELFRDQAVRLVTAPSAGSPLYIRTRCRPAVLAGRERPVDGHQHRAGAGLTHLRRLRLSGSASSAAPPAGRRGRRRCCRRSCRSSPCRRPAPGGPRPPADRRAGRRGGPPSRCRARAPPGPRSASCRAGSPRRRADPGGAGRRGPWTRRPCAPCAR